LEHGGKAPRVLLLAKIGERRTLVKEMTEKTGNVFGCIAHPPPDPVPLIG